ncbi:MAG: branched-chain amino acid transport system substrate-binding protein [Bradyrhizobium sp.]|nr:branched-chain amino acid transport system substrate-binding protein [Bradyrhizobium sp.]
MRVTQFLMMALLATLPFGAQAAEPGVTDTEVTVGAFLGLSGDFALSSRDVQLATEAYFKKVNEAGGVNGRKLRFVAMDDGYVPSRSAAVARRLVEQENVFAIVQALGTANALAAMPFVQSKGVPMLAIHGYSRKLYRPAQKFVYGNWTEFPLQMKIMVDYFLSKGPVKQFGMIYYDNEGGLEGLEGAREAAKARGQDVIMAPVPASAPDYRSAILNLRDKGVTHLLITLGPADAARAIVQAREAGWNPMFGGHQGTPDPLTIQLGKGAIEGVYGVATSALPGWPLSDWPGVKDYQDALAKYSPDAKPSAFGIRAYADSIIFVEALKRAGPQPTREKLIQALEGMRDFETGIYPPVTYGPDQHDGNKGAVITQAKDGKWVPITGWVKGN